MPKTCQGQGALVKKKKKLGFQLTPGKGTRNKAASIKPKGYVHEKNIKPCEGNYHLQSPPFLFFKMFSIQYKLPRTQRKGIKCCSPKKPRNKKIKTEPNSQKVEIIQVSTNR